MVALPRRVFKCGGDVPGFQQRIVDEDFLTAGPCSKQIKHVLDADAKTPQAWPPAALSWIGGDTMDFARADLPIPGIVVNIAGAGDKRSARRAAENGGTG
jgi:hypothetical protein